MPKRVAINISLPDQAFKDKVNLLEKKHGKVPSKEFVRVYKRLFRKYPV